MSEFRKIISKFSKDSRNLFWLIQKHGQMTKGNLIDITKIPLSSLNRFMYPLEDSKLIIPCHLGESSGGRKPVLYDVNTNIAFVVGIDISRTHTIIIIANIKMEVMYRRQFSMDAKCSPDVTFDRIVSIINDGISTLAIEKKNIIGVGIGVVGPLDVSNGVIMNPIGFPATGWHDINIKKFMEEKTGLPCIVDNGSNCAVFAEFMYGIGKIPLPSSKGSVVNAEGFQGTFSEKVLRKNKLFQKNVIKDLAYFNCGIGIRTSIISEGTLVRSINDFEDAFGHMVIDVDGELCSCGNYGCIECYSSAYSIVNKFVSSVKRGRITGISKNLDEIDYLDICNNADNGDELSREVVKSGASILGTGLANFINLLNPSLIILSGSLVWHSKLYYDTCIEVATRRNLLRGEKKIMFSKGGEFKENAISIGAAAVMLENIIKVS